MIFAVADLAFDHDRLQHIVLREHIFDIRINLCNCIHALHNDTVCLREFCQYTVDETR